MTDKRHELNHTHRPKRVAVPTNTSCSNDGHHDDFPDLLMLGAKRRSRAEIETPAMELTVDHGRATKASTEILIERETPIIDALPGTDPNDGVSAALAGAVTNANPRADQGPAKNPKPASARGDRRATP